VERWKLKNGVEDLHKARHFLDKYIELNEPPPIPRTPVELVNAQLEQSPWPKSMPGVFGYEGGTAGSDNYRCSKCRTFFTVPANESPFNGNHVCPRNYL
jgi:hypothetical protein